MLLNVQMLRGLAALLVVFVHLEVLGQMAGLSEGWPLFGNSGVDLFFVISGMIMVMTTAEGLHTPASFMRNRLIRVAPLYWAVTFFVFAIALAAPSLMQTTTADPVQLLKSLAFIPFERADGTVRPTVFLGWTLNYEMAFYAIFALGLALPGRRLGLAVTGGLLVALATFGLLLRPEQPLLAFYLQPLIYEFAAGMALGALMPKGPIARSWRWPAAGAGVAAFAAMIAAGQLWPQAERALVSGAPAVVIVACAVVAERAGLKAGQAWIQLLGAASYSIYLTHFFCTTAATKLAQSMQLSPAMLIASFPLIFLLVAIVGGLVHLKIELPLTGLVRRWMRPNSAASRTDRQPSAGI